MDECRWLVSEYNDIYGLSMAKDSIEQCIKTSSNSQGTHIDTLLKELLQTVQWYWNIYIHIYQTQWL